jgi:hypothetical protein
LFGVYNFEGKRSFPTCDVTTVVSAKTQKAILQMIIEWLPTSKRRYSLILKSKLFLERNFNFIFKDIKALKRHYLL